MVEVTKPQNHWATLGAIKAARALIKAADDLSFAAQITGGTAGRDAALCAAIAQWTAERDKQKQVLRIIELEGDDPEIGVGFELFPATLTTENAALAARVEALEGALAGLVPTPCEEGCGHCCCECETCCDCDQPVTINPDWQNAETCLQNVAIAIANDTVFDENGPVDTVISSGDLQCLFGLACAAFSARAALAGDPS